MQPTYRVRVHDLCARGIALRSSAARNCKLACTMCDGPQRAAHHSSSSSSSNTINLMGRRVGIFWDLDNVIPSSLSLDLPDAVQELQMLLASCGGSMASVTMYANSHTCACISQSLRQQLAVLGIQLSQVPARRQAADMQLAADAYHFAQQHKKQGCLVCVSNDTGFAPLLSYASSLGAISIIMAGFPSPKYWPGLLPDLQQHPLASACHAAVSWQPAAGAAARQQQQQQQQASEDAGKARTAQLDTELRNRDCNPAVTDASIGRGKGSTVDRNSSGNIISSSTSNNASSASSGGNSSGSKGRVPRLNCCDWHMMPPAPGAAVRFIEAVWVNPAQVAVADK